MSGKGGSDPSSREALAGPPSTLSLYGRAALGSLPLVGHLPFVAGGGGEIPDVELLLEDVEVDVGRLAEYCGVCGFALRDTLPATYPHILAFPLHMALMTRSDFPFAAVGLVHISNRITQHRPIRVGERLEVSVNSGPLVPHPKGRAFTLVSEARVGEELVWEGESTNLRRGGGDESGAAEAAGAGAEAVEPGPDARPELRDEAEWQLPGDLGRRYGGASGDRNPIHMYGLTANAFGFPRQIAHGMWTKARCVAALEPRLPGAFSVEVAFKRPILLPSKVVFATGGADARDEGTGAGVAFSVRSARDGTPHLTGSTR